MLYSTLVLFHIAAAVVGLLSGAMSMLLRKGSDLHRAAGTVFFVSMLCMSGAGAYLAAFVKPNGGNVMGGTLTFYLVATGWKAAHRRERGVDAFDYVALLAILGVAAGGAALGLAAASSSTGRKFGYPPSLYFIFGSIALLFAASDVRMLIHGGVTGARRLARHLWRMCLALLIALLSFYPSRESLFSAAIRESRVMYLPHLLLAGAVIYWMVRLSRRKRAESRGADTPATFSPDRAQARVSVPHRTQDRARTGVSVPHADPQPRLAVIERGRS